MLLPLGLIAIACNMTMLWIVSREFRRHGIAAKLNSRDRTIAILLWTVLEITIGSKYREAPFVYAALMGAIGVGAVTDAISGYVLDAVTLPSCAFALAASVPDGGVDRLAGALAASGSMFFLYMVSRRQGLGLGDVKLAGAAGALLGVQAGLLSLGIAFVAGGSVAALLILRRRATRKTAVPFAPYIALGTLGVLTLSPV